MPIQSESRRGFIRSTLGIASSLLFWPEFARAAGFYNLAAFWQDRSPLIHQFWVWGVNTYGQLGTGNLTTYSSPVQIHGSWAQVDSAWTTKTTSTTVTSFSLGLHADGTLWSWGDNTYGELGHGTSGAATSTSSPVQITGKSWTQISCGAQGWDNPFAMAIRSDGTLWAWGDNTAGQLGQGNTISYSSPVQIMPGTSWSMINAGYWEWMGIKTNGTLWTCGAQFAGEMGTGSSQSFISTPVQLAGSWTQAVVRCDSSAGGVAGGIRVDGSLWMWGGNGNGDLGTGDGIGYSSPVQIGTSSWSQLSLGLCSTTLAIRRDGTLWGWGANNTGQLGIGNTTQQNTPTQISSLTWRSTFVIDTNTGGCGFAVRSDGSLWGWGDNSSGCLGLGNLISYSSPVQIMSGIVASISGGQNTPMVLR